MPHSWALTWSSALTWADGRKHSYRQGCTETRTHKITLALQPHPHIWLEANVTRTKPHSHQSHRCSHRLLFSALTQVPSQPQGLTQSGLLGSWVQPMKGGINKFFLWITG